MGEIKSVKVDNWGAFFLQKLQNFFNKTDYCDLTLQFNDNSQLKVHKLVLSACTDYFNVLEQTCEMIDDILIMPNELQADLVVPIVNFMYTGTLEFELKMYGKLLKTARDMNMTVLLKLLEAHRRTMESGSKQVIRNTKTSPRQTYLNAGIKSTAIIPAIIETSSGTSQVKRRILSTTSTTTTKIEPYRRLQIKPVNTTAYSDSNTIITKYPNTKITPVKGPSRFDYEGENILHDTFDSFDTISYESKPLKEDIIDEELKQESATSIQFEQLRRTGYNNNKRPAQSILQSPPSKKPNIQDVKEYAEQQRMRKQIAEEYGEEYDDTLDDEFHNADDDEEYIPTSSIQQQTKAIIATSSNNLKQKTAQQNQVFKKTTNTKQQDEKPRIVVKDSTSSNVDHAKIISEVLRKYPHLIKNNKNIKLKIMPNASGNGGPQRVVIKKEPDTNSAPVPSTSKTAISNAQDTKLLKVSPTQQKVSTGAQPRSSTVTTPAAQPSSQPRRIDSKIMKALISLGAENTTGPWLCLRCGVNGRPISIPSYRGFRRHLINTHKEKIDPRLCEYCGWRSTTNKELLFHMQMDHQIKSNLNFPKCEHCGVVVLDLSALDDHINEHHLENKEENQQCIYCNKTFSVEILLYNHMKTEHKERAKEDGVIDFSDDEHIEEFDDTNDNKNYEKESSSEKHSKIQILSDINLPKCISLTKTTTDLQQSTPDTTTLSNVDYITTSSGLETIDTGPKFVNAEGNVMELTPAQRDEIISQLEQSGDGVVMVLNDEPFANDDKVDDIGDTSGAQQLADNNMLIVYDEQQVSEKTDKKSIEKNNKEDVDEEMEWKDDVTEEDIKEKPSKNSEIEKTIDEEDINDKSEIKKEDKDSSDLDMKLKLLTGDWTEDEDEECAPGDNDKENQAEKTDDDKILDILEKNNDSAELVDENKKVDIKEETEDIDVKTEIEEKDKNVEEDAIVSAKTDKEIDIIEDNERTDDKNIDSEQSFESESNDKEGEVLYSTVVLFNEDKTTEESEEGAKTENDSRKENDNDTKENTEVEKDSQKDDEEKDSEVDTTEIKNKNEVIENEKSTAEPGESSVVPDNYVDNDSSKKKDDESVTHDTQNVEKLDVKKNKSEENTENNETKSTIKNKDDSDDLSQTKAKDEIKSLISEWGDDDEDL